MTQETYIGITRRSVASTNISTTQVGKGRFDIVKTISFAHELDGSTWFESCCNITKDSFTVSAIADVDALTGGSVHWIASNHCI
jgi:hypothetical protein